MNIININNSNYYLLVIIITIAFTKGVLALIGINETISQLIIDFLITLVIIKALTNIIINRSIKGPGLVLNAILILTIILSFLLTSVNEIQMILFFRHFFIYYLFFYAFYNIYINEHQKNKLKNLIIFLFSIQVIAALIKLITIGTGENFIGTISIEEGSLATIMPLFASAYLLSKYMVDRKNIYLISVLLFILIGLISNKIGIMYYIIIVYSFIIYKYTGISVTLLKKGLTSIIFLIILGSLFISLNPRMNPERKIGGSIDIDYLITYSQEYQTLKTNTDVDGDGRFEAPFIALNRMADGGFINILFGFGPGELIKSSFTQYDKPLLEKYNIGYGGRIALVWIIMQLGIVGLFIILYFHYLLYRRILKTYNKNIFNKEHQILLLTFQGFSLIFILDFFTYSPTVIGNSAIVITYFFTFFYISTYKGETNAK